MGGGLLQAAIPVVLALVAYQGGVTRISRLRSMIRADMELLDKLPAGHPSREALTGHIEMLVYKLVRRERRQAQPFTETGVTFGVTAAIAGIFLLGAIVGALEAVGWYTSEPDPETREYAWMEWASPLVIGLICAWFALRAWRRGTQEHEVAEGSWIPPVVQEPEPIHPQPS